MPERSNKVNRFSNAGKNLLKSSGNGSPVSELSEAKKDAAEKIFPADSEYRYLPAKKIVPSPFNDGMPSDEKTVREYAESMKDNGMIQPIIVYEREDGMYELISGHQRYTAWCDILGNQMIPAVIRKMEPDIRKRFAAHTEANTKNRKLGAQFWCSRMEIAKKVIFESGGAESRADEVAQMCRMLGLGQAQLYRYEQFGRLSESLKNLEKQGSLSVKAAVLAKDLSIEQQNRLAGAIEKAIHPETGDIPVISERDMKELIRSICTDQNQKGKKEKNFSHADRLEKAGDAFLRIALKSRTDAQKQASLEAIAKLKEQLKEAEEKLRYKQEEKI